MTNQQRAKQFMPFAALKGFEEAIAYQQRVREERIILGEDAAAELNRRLTALEKGDRVTAEYYSEERYVSVSGKIKKLDFDMGFIYLDNIKIPIADLKNINKSDKETIL